MTDQQPPARAGLTCLVRGRTVLAAVACLAALLYFRGAALAGSMSFYVSSLAIANAGADPYAESLYNFSSEFLTQGPDGSTLQTGNCASGCTASVSGTNTGNTLLTSSSSSASIATTSPGFSGTAAATANLATGDIGVYANGQGELFGNQGGQGVADAYQQDTLTFHNLPAGTSDIGVSFVVHGSLSASPPAGDASVRAVDGFGNGAIDTIVEDNSGTSFVPSLDYFDANGGWASYSISDTDLNDMVFQGEYAVSNADPTLGLSMYLTVTCAFGADCDYSDTNSIALTLPPGVTFTSDSGVFLSAVPEPAGWMTLLPTLGVLGFLARGRDRRLTVGRPKPT